MSILREFSPKLIEVIFYVLWYDYSNVNTIHDQPLILCKIPFIHFEHDHLDYVTEQTSHNLCALTFQCLTQP